MLAFTFNGIGIPLAATGLVYPVWAMAAMAASVTSLFINSIGGRPRLLLEAIGSVGATPAGTGRDGSTVMSGSAPAGPPRWEDGRASRRPARRPRPASGRLCGLRHVDGAGRRRGGRLGDGGGHGRHRAHPAAPTRGCSARSSGSGPGC